MKQNMTGTAFGVFLQTTRDWMSYHRQPFANLEKAAGIANDVLATRLITRLCPKGGTFLDVGGHIGSVFGAALKADPTLDVFVVEADSEKAKRLERRFPGTTIFDCAVGEDNGTATFYVDADHPGFSSLAEREETGAGRTVDIRRLDDLLGETKVDIMKIDIEGAELGALRGGREMLARSRPVILFESSELTPNSLGYAAEDLWRWFQDEEFDVFSPDRLAHTAPPMALEVFLDAHAYPFRTRNYFAVPRERRPEIRDRARRILNVPGGRTAGAQT